MTIEEQLKKFLGKEPKIHASAYIASSAELIGDVTIAENSSIWPHCVLRADINSIEIGKASNVQDGSVLHLDDDYGVKIGDYVTIGHLAMIHACTIENECLIGMHSTILDGAQIGHHSVIAAHALVTKRTIVPPGSLVAGVPGKVIRVLDEQEQEKIRYWAEKYTKVAAAHKRKALESKSG
jgi:gamma-carbonic anhydrase